MKLFKVLTTEFALNDLELGRAFYAQTSKELGDYFYDTIISDLESLQFYAGIHLKEDNFYKMFSQKFPYSIYYDVLEDDIAQVVAIFDQRREPTVQYEELKIRL